MLRISEKIEKGEGLSIDEGVIIGYLSPRGGVSEKLIIGDNGRVRSGSVIYAGSTIGNNLETGHNVVIREQNEIGDDFSIWNNSVIDYGCKIGNGVKVHCNIYIPQYTVIEDDVFMAPGVTIANDIHPGCPESGECMRGPVLKKGCRLGVNVVLVPYVTIGEETLVGAGSVVTRDLPPGVLAYGNPARVKANLSELDCKTGRREAPYR
ncbi:MAG: N-acetyltransferase [Candidatus Latescibacteria bacterium]|nr:N-acetyltransferase [bacterium]MBD3424712.1 N-acetyltransferase [Candidatus Latescibacterota bacterium]